ncbi:MAG: NUDIX hydrolase [Hyphomicrobiales bacterium]|nr:NUDIX hydrolase [Hyphomicrobiales bacterium]
MTGSDDNRDGITIRSRKRVYDGWSRVDEVIADVRHPDGSVSTLRHEIRDHGIATAALAFDPEARTVLLVRQLRLPVHLSGDDGYVLEAIAGLIEARDDNAEACITREAMEETGCRITDLEPIANAYCSPGSITEKLALFLARYRHGEAVARAGLAHEDEDIEVVEISTDAFWQLIEAGKINDLKTLALGYALRTRYPQLFA